MIVIDSIIRRNLTISAATFDSNATSTSSPAPENVAGAQAVGYSSVAALVFLLYDIIITFDDEVQIMWPISWSFAKCLFFFIRYFSVILQVSVMFLGTPTLSFTNHQCYIWNMYQSIGSMLIIAAVDYILILRVFALYCKNRSVQYFVACIYVAEVAAVATGIGVAVPHLIYDEYCTILDAPTTLLISAGAPIVFQATLFGLTGWKFIRAMRAGWGNAPIVKLLMRDGTWAFILLFAILLSEAAMYGFAPEAYTSFLYCWLNTVFAFCGYRILLNLNKLNTRHHSTNLRSSSSRTGPDIQFTSNVYTGPSSYDESHQMDDFFLHSQSRPGAEDRQLGTVKSRSDSEETVPRINS